MVTLDRLTNNFQLQFLAPYFELVLLLLLLLLLQLLLMLIVTRLLLMVVVKGERVGAKRSLV
jgi:hypothetical protein